MIGGKAIIVVGMTGAGKSTFTKKRVKGVSNLHVYDVNKEYFPDKPLSSMKQFLLEIKEVRNGVIVFEDATGFFSNRGHNEEMTQMLVAKRHRELVIYLLFHSIRAIPYYIFDLCNYVVVFNTNDTPDLVEKKLAQLLPAYEKVKDIPYKYEIVKL